MKRMSIEAWCCCSKVVRARLRHFDLPPQAVHLDNLRFYMLLNLAQSLAWAAHIAWGIAFVRMGLKLPAMMQPLCIALYVGAIWLNRLGRHMISMWLSIGVLVAHGVLMATQIGQAAGFQYFLPIAALFPFLLPRGPLAGKLLLLLYATAGFALTAMLPPFHATYRLMPEHLRFLQVLNIIFLFAGLTMLALYLSVSELRWQRMSEALTRHRHEDEREAAAREAREREEALHHAYQRELAATRDVQVAEASIQKLRGATLLTDEQWADFRNSFEEAHPGFLSRLRAKMPDLTPAEVRFVVLSKLQLDAKDMAAMLGVGPAAIRKYRFRLRAKLNLPADSPIEELVAVI